VHTYVSIRHYFESFEILEILEDTLSYAVAPSIIALYCN